jgi:hypothetical protein
MAALVGKVHVVASLLAQLGPGSNPPTLPDGTPVQTPESAQRAAFALMGYAAFGAPVDSIRALAERVTSEIRAWLPMDRRPAATIALLRGPAELTFTTLGPSQLHRRLPPNAPWLMETQALAARGEIAIVRGRLDTLLADLRADPWHPRSPAAMLHTALLALALRDTARATSVIEHVLGGVRNAPDVLLEDAAEVASLVRATGLRAELAAAAGDAASMRRWSAALVGMWGNADRALTPIVARVRALRPQRPSS